MRLIPDCPHGDNCSAMIACCPDVRAITDPAGILAALGEAGVLEWRSENEDLRPDGRPGGRYVSQWQPADQMDSVGVIRAVREEMAKSFFAGWEEE